MDSADTAIEVGDDEFWMLMAGRQLAARDRRVLTAVAKQAAGLVKQRELTEEAGLTMHVRLLHGEDPQHVLRAIFKALGGALASAAAPRKE